MNNALPSILNILGLAFPWFWFAANTIFFKSKFKIFFIVLSFITTYLLMVSSVHFIDLALEEEFEKIVQYDKIHLGEGKTSPEQDKLIIDINNDTGRALAPITGAIFSAIYTPIVYLFVLFAAAFIKKLRSSKKFYGNEKTPNPSINRDG